MNRHQAARAVVGAQLRRQLEGRGSGASSRELAEETSTA